MTTGCVFAELSEQRTRLTLRLRELAAELDRMDRQILDGPCGRQDVHTLRNGELKHDLISDLKSGLKSDYARLTVTLHRLAAQLRHLDSRMSEIKSGTGACPQCGYPTLGSTLCAFCPPSGRH